MNTAHPTLEQWIEAMKRHSIGTRTNLVLKHNSTLAVAHFIKDEAIIETRRLYIL